jgi:hypothetical protein
MAVQPPLLPRNWGGARGKASMNISHAASPVKHRGLLPSEGMLTDYLN